MVKTKRYGDWFEITVPKDWEGVTSEDLFKKFWKAPKTITHQMRMAKDVTLGGQPVNWSTPLAMGDKLQLRLFKEETVDINPYYYDLEVLFEDDHLAIFNKPAHMDTHPNSPQQSDTLANAAAFHMQMNGEIRKIKHIHRLDKDTSGAILFAKHPLAGSILDIMLEERLIKRTYIAAVHGIMAKKKGVINAPIGRDRHHPTRRRLSSSGQTAITKYEVLHILQGENITIIKCQLDTGRTHQIRVHLSSIGHPIVGDVLYGGENLIDRQALHAAKLELHHPLTKESIAVTCMPPNDLNPYFSKVAKI
ncbi:RluA family pseudouridine synthase [Cytobacillus purgationiresistens]|uniref:Pseudouridine synthase n=1 Tax=Cytobacillus purgationiresistens TaxID=863449 RepID=A0ABU0AQT1_9BACI|nr:RluA family pseudouridine synthase [Cytobacillus purgationiresistens]MDQ0273629.1 23S rRNA pseudouridine1911/1915/1917 synthase [Cytobacillus purgationiresistens]